MFQIKKNTINVKSIVKFLNAKYYGEDFSINGFSSLNNVKDNTILFFSDLINFKFKLKDNSSYDLKKLEKFQNVVLIADKQLCKYLNIPIIHSQNPRYDFYRVISEFFSQNEFVPGIHKTAVIEKQTNLGTNIHIGANCYVGNNVTIGNNTIILPNTTIFGNTSIGSNCVIKSNTTIGSEGFSFTFSNDELLHFPHLGTILIGNNVWIGSNCTVEKAQIDNTVIEDHVKIDDLVQIGHNSIIKKFTQIAAGCIIAGRVIIDEGTWVSSNSVIDNGCKLGKNCLVGTSTLIRSDFPDNSKIVGSPGKILDKK